MYTKVPIFSRTHDGGVIVMTIYDRQQLSEVCSSRSQS
jgi:hypothetical protein